MEYPIFSSPVIIEGLPLIPSSMPEFWVTSELWYKDGLRFTCTRCGHCCTGEPGFVWVDDDDLAAIALERGETLAEVRARYSRPTPLGRTLREKSNGDCIFYD